MINFIFHSRRSSRTPRNGEKVHLLMAQATNQISWIDWYLQLPCNKYMLRVESFFIDDMFNLYGLNKCVRNFKCTLEFIKGPYIRPENRSNSAPPDLDAAAATLYNLIHARYLQTSSAIDEMYKKYEREDFERCPRVACRKTKCLPYGNSESPSTDRLRFYCPSCLELYSSDDPIIEGVDGAAFGPSWVFLFLKKHPNVVPASPPVKPEFRLFGFRLENLSPSSEEDYDQE